MNTRRRRRAPSGAAIIRGPANLAGSVHRSLRPGLAFTYDVPGNYLRPSRTVRHLSKTNFARALEAMPAVGPGAIPARQGSSYTWAILMDDRIRSGDW
ncbi:hypothetical protein EV644_106435 [Kribbella orskensis]|uniref:Uncharacterized protein n=1 Tax=Kribbella orskensis TaxID=2512216 RepID=A0ABY2BLD2_9ACTN|nr:hypothetical protein EV642_105435 [Kribbella sp. VKM Ac-2500]TCO23126.1 hypothetical protein EV644_106435 [Kribbella orskensis]